MISRTVMADPKFRSVLQARSKASPIAKVATSSNQTFRIGMIFIGTSRKERLCGLYEKRSFGEKSELALVATRGVAIFLTFFDFLVGFFATLDFLVFLAI